jgi:hypothetical protein
MTTSPRWNGRVRVFLVALFTAWGLLLLAGFALAQASVPKAPPAAGCVVCGGPAGADALEETYAGRRVLVCRNCGEAAWLANRDVVMTKLQARGALFDEHAETGSLVSGWMWFGVWALAGVICAAASCYVALSKGLDPLPWMLASLAFNVVALLLVAMRARGDTSALPQGVPAGLAKIPETRAPSACPNCRAANHPSAARCSACGAALTAAGASEVERALKTSNS